MLLWDLVNEGRGCRGGGGGNTMLSLAYIVSTAYFDRYLTSFEQLYEIGSQRRGNKF